jgi:diadenylate cyclase
VSPTYLVPHLKYLLSYWKIILELTILWYVIYIALVFIKGTRAAQLLKGLVILIIIFLASQQFEFEVINWVLTRFFAISIVAFLIIFQPELRKGLARLGQFGIFQENIEILNEVARAALLLSQKRMGAIIAIERESSLKPYTETSTLIDAAVTKELILAICSPTSPIHDGGIVIQSGRITAAGCLFPIGEGGGVSYAIGTRHRAAMSLSEETDAVVVVVSEETGSISISIGGKLTRNLDEDNIEKVLRDVFSRPRRGKRRLDFSKMFKST